MSGWRSLVVDVLGDIADVDAQRSYWVGGVGRPVPPPTELVCMLFDDTALDFELDAGTVFSEECDKLLRRLGTLCDAAPLAGKAAEVMETPEWREIMSVAGAALKCIDALRSDQKGACHFFVSMLAPGGLAALTPYLGTCRMPLGLQVSGYNGKTILGLAEGAGEDLEWEMDSSDTDVMSAHGRIVGEVDRSALLLQSLSDCLRAAGVPHEVAADFGTDTGEVTRRWSFEWADE